VTVTVTSELSPHQLDLLRTYAAGFFGTRETIDRAGMHDYADPVIGMAKRSRHAETVGNTRA
jgi:hypothetical protein